MKRDESSATSSEKLFERAKAAIAGGVSHENRYVEPYPIYVRRAEGAYKWDVEGRKYLDFSMGSASLLLGHAHPAVVSALCEYAPLGTYTANCHPLEIEWAELVQGMFPAAERLRFTASGTEATMLAVRLARAFTGKRKVLRFEQHYHGWHDYVAYGMLAPYHEVPSLGIPETLGDLTVVTKADENCVRQALMFDDDIAAIICEVSGANWGSVPLSEDFLSVLRLVADEYGVLLVFDEVITGFRWSPGGLQQLVGVRPDLTTFAKILTGGLPGGAVGGREDIMRLLDPAVSFKGRRPAVTHKGTFNGAPLIAAAAIAALRVVRTGEAQRHADKMAARIREGMRGIMQSHQVQGAAYGSSSTFHAYFGPLDAMGGVGHLEAATIRGMPKGLVRGYQAGLRKRSVDLMSYMGGVTSLSHGEEDVDFFLDAFEDTIRELIGAGLVKRV